MENKEEKEPKKKDVKTKEAKAKKNHNMREAGHRIGIRWQVFGSLLLFTVILIALLWVLLTVYLGTIYRNIKISQLTDARKAVEKIVGNGWDENGESLETLAKDYDIRVLIASENGEVQYSSSNLFEMADTIFAFPSYYDLAQENGGYAEIYMDGDARLEKLPFDEKNVDEEKNVDNGAIHINKGGMHQNQSLTQIKIVTDGTNTRIIVLTSLITPVEATVTTLRILLGWITVAMVVVSLVVALVLARHISKPIVDVNENAKRLAEADYSVVFPKSGYREIAELSDTLNYAAVQLGKTEQLQRDLVANVSHDLRTPLTMIKGYAEVMRDIPGESTPENVQIIIDETERLSGLVNDLLDVGKLQAGVESMKLANYNLTESIERVLLRYNKLKENDGYRIDFEYTEPAYVQADEEKIYQVLYNLINNAINYTGENKRVTVRQVISGNQVTVQVQDYGEGITKEEIPYVWDRYYKTDKTHKRAIMGTGLGLSIVQNVLKMHQAEYGVESEEGKGCIFWFTLPCN